MVLHIQIMQYLLQLFNPWLCFNGIYHPQLQPVCNTVDEKQMSNLFLELCSHTGLLPHIDSYTISTKEDQLLLPLFQACFLKHIRKKKQLFIGQEQLNVITVLNIGVPDCTTESTPAVCACLTSSMPRKDWTTPLSLLKNLTYTISFSRIPLSVAPSIMTLM